MKISRENWNNWTTPMGDVSLPQGVPLVVFEESEEEEESSQNSSPIYIHSVPPTITPPTITPPTITSPQSSSLPPFSPPLPSPNENLNRTPPNQNLPRSQPSPVRKRRRVIPEHFQKCSFCKLKFARLEHHLKNERNSCYRRRKNCPIEATEKCRKIRYLDHQIEKTFSR